MASSSLPAAGRALGGPLRRFARRHKINVGLLFVAPAVAVFLLYVGWPVVSMFEYSLFNWDGLSPTRTFVGLQNYVELLTDDRAFRSSISNNLLWAAITLSVLLTAGFLLAYVLSQRLRIANVYRTAFFLPTAASVVVIGYVWQIIYDPSGGPLNAALRESGLGHLTRVWLADPDLTLFAVIAVAIWATLGIFIVVQIAAIQSISRDLFDSSAIDGASSLQQLRYIAIPLTSVTRRALIILGSIAAVNEFGFVFLLSRGGPFHASEVMAYQIYALAFELNRTGYATALSVVLLLISIAITIPQLLMLRRRREQAT